ncbi:DUF6969 family protein [Acidihalobacter ferrooxydans]|uniref:DUF6969 family protein n=1 Tax=Acidihalobacter ferrooxydans TaxID=1765967 RepID=UPI0012EC21AE|nr:hypothetical protein [Acidihalobacter ferrooxydans]
MPLARTFTPQMRESLLVAGQEVHECMRVLEKAELNLVGEILRGQGEFVEFEHYPHDDVSDHETHSQYYYHSHGDNRRPEHGHFHTFIRTGELVPTPKTAQPRPDADEWPSGDAALAHIISIAMDDWGYPLGLFATNRWVTGETWYPAPTLIQLLPRFEIDHAYPSWPTNRWITALLRLFRPHIEELLLHRDAVIQAWQQNHPEQDALEDRALEITGYIPISVEQWMHELTS